MHRAFAEEFFTFSMATDKRQRGIPLLALALVRLECGTAAQIPFAWGVTLRRDQLAWALVNCSRAFCAGA